MWYQVQHQTWQLWMQTWTHLLLQHLTELQCWICSEFLHFYQRIRQVDETKQSIFLQHYYSRRRFEQIQRQGSSQTFKGLFPKLGRSKRGGSGHFGRRSQRPRVGETAYNKKIWSSRRFEPNKTSSPSKPKSVYYYQKDCTNNYHPCRKHNCNNYNFKTRHSQGSHPFKLHTLPNLRSPTSRGWASWRQKTVSLVLLWAHLRTSHAPSDRAHYTNGPLTLSVSTLGISTSGVSAFVGILNTTELCNFVPE